MTHTRRPEDSLGTQFSPLQVLEIALLVGPICKPSFNTVSHLTGPQTWCFKSETEY